MNKVCFKNEFLKWLLKKGIKPFSWEYQVFGQLLNFYIII